MRREFENHHLLFPRRTWERESGVHKELRRHPAYSINRFPGNWHGYLHRVVDAVPVPSAIATEDLIEVGNETMRYGDNERLDHMLDLMAGLANVYRFQDRRKEVCNIMASLSAQFAIYDLSQTMDLRE